MALPPLEGDITLRDNFDKITQRADALVARIEAINNSVNSAQQALSGLGNAPLPQARQQAAAKEDTSAAKAAAREREAIAKTEYDNRIILASQSVGKIANTEALITQAAQQEQQRRVALSGQEADARRATLQSSLKSLSGGEIAQLDAKLVDLGRQAEIARQKISEIDKKTGASGAGNQSKERVAATRSEVREREALVRQLASIQQQQEKTVTAAVQAEAAKRAQIEQQRLQRQQNFTPGNVLKGVAGGIVGGIAGGDLGALVGGAAAGGPVGLAVAGLTQAAVKVEAFARSMVNANTELKRLQFTFTELSGSVAQAEGNIIAIQAGFGGTIDRVGAMKIANQALALSLADTGAEFGRLAQAARIVTIISPVIKDAENAISNLGLAAANLSFRRLDQLGLSVTEVRNGMKQLQAENSALSDSEAFLEASIAALIAKGGDLVNSTEAQASGVERLNVAWSDWWNQQSVIAQGIDGVYGKAADALNRILVLTGQADSKATGDFIDAQVRDVENKIGRLNADLEQQDSPLAAMFGLNDRGDKEKMRAELQDRLDMLNQLKEAQAQAQADLVNGVPGAKAFADSLEVIAGDTELVDLGLLDIDGIVARIKAARIEFEGFQKLQGDASQDIDKLRNKRIFDEQNAQAFGERLTEINTAIAQLDQFKGTGLEKVFGGLAEQGRGIQGAFISTGEVPEGAEKQLALIQGAAESAGKSSEFLEQANTRLGSSFVESSVAVQAVIEAYAQLQANQAAGLVDAPKFAAGLKVINEEMDRLAQARELSFTAGLEQASKGIAQVDELTQSGVTGLENYRKTYQDTTAAIIANGGATQQQLDVLADTKAAVEATAAVQTRYKESFAGVSAEFIASSAAAQQLVVQIAQVSAQQQRKKILDEDARKATALLVAELQRLAATDADNAIRAFAEASAKAVSSNVQLVDAVSGLPIAFDTARLRGDALSNTLNQLIADAQNLGAAAANASFSLASGLIPKLGVGGAIQQGLQFQQQQQALTNSFLQANSQRVQQGQNPIDNSVLQFGLGAISQYQNAFVQDATRVADEVGGAVDDIGKRINDALEGVIEGVLSPTTGGLLPDEVVKELLPREDALDEQARRLADVAVKGFESPWFEGLKDLEIFPQSVLDEGEQAIRRFAAEGVQRHTDGLTTEFYNVDAAVQQVIEKLQANQARAGFLEQVREQVKAVAGDVDDLDLQEALGIDVAPQRAAQATRSALEGLPTPEEIMAQMQELFAGGSPLAEGLTITPEQQGLLQENATTTVGEMGEAAVAQAEAGAYGPRVADTLLANIESKKEEIAKSGRNLATWLGDALLLEFRTSVPAGLLDILVLGLVPLLGAAQAKEAERTGGTAVQ